MAATFILLVILPLSASSAPLQLLSVRESSMTQPAGGSGNSVAPWISADGRFVLFSSSANDLVSDDNGQLGLDIFLRDRASNTTVLVSANFSGTGGGNGSSMSGMISTNGRYVVFESVASDLVPGDTNGVSDIFVRDLLTGTNQLVSVATNGGPADNASSDAVMTPDGRYVAFISAATNLVTSDTNGIPDVFVRDLVSQTTTLASLNASGANSVMATPVISPNGRYVAFFSTAKNLAAGVSASSQGEVYLRDLVANTTTWASTNATAIVSNTIHLNYTPSYHPALSADGRFVAFKTGSTNGAVAPSGSLIFQYDSTTGLLSVMSTNGFPKWLYSDDIYGPEMTPDGRFIAFVATNKAPAGTSVQLWDAQTGTNILVSVAQDGSFPTNTLSDTPVLSPDGRFVVFVSNATNLVSNTISNGFHIYLRDVQAGLTQLVDTDTNGIGSTDNAGTIPSLSADGRLVVFSSPDGQLISADNNRALDVFLRDSAGGTNELISQRDLTIIPQTGDGISLLSQFSLSDDGRWIAFVSHADDLVPNDTNGASDIFVHDLTTGTNILVSVGTNGSPALGGFSANPVLSRNGRFVAFVSAATNLADGVSAYNHAFFNNIFLRDLQAGTTVAISVSSNGVSGNNDSSAPALSQDGRWIAFLSKANNFIPGVTGAGPMTYLRDMSSGSIVSLTGNSSSTLPPSMGSDGRYVAYFGGSSQLWVRDTQLGANIYTNSAVVTSAGLSPTGTRLLYTTSTGIFAVDLINKSNLFSIPAKVPIQNSAPWSADGRFFTFVTDTNAAPGDDNGANDVYLCDLLTDTLTLVSLNSTLTGSANARSDWPAVSGDGRFVMYRSFATNIVSGNTNPPPNILLFDRFTGSNTLLTAASPGSSWTSWNSKPAINGDGKTVTFQSWGPGFVPNDLNRVQDVFAVTLSPWGTTDSDGDGIPDSWMTHYFGHPTGQASDHSQAQDDADGDGMTNLQEFLAGTDPTDPASVLHIQIAPVVSSTNVILSWLAVPGKSYQVQYKDNLSDSLWLNAPGNVSVVGTQAYFTVPADQPNRFYRLVNMN
jgi:Tol biopolymer transport system component